jgi:hypothetical protein
MDKIPEGATPSTRNGFPVPFLLEAGPKESAGKKSVCPVR